MKQILQKIILAVLFCFAMSQHLFAQRLMEKLGRGVVATRTSSAKVLVSWRLLGTEPQDIGFNVYRSSNGGIPVKLNSSVLTEGTNFEDLSANLSVPNSYFVKPVIAGQEKDASAAYTLVANAEAKPFYKIKIRNTTGYRLEYAYVGDFDGDGEYDYVMHKIPISDGSLPDLVEAYKRDGTYLWTVNMGPNSVNRYNITPGSSALDAGHGDNWTVYDLNHDGKAEVILRTANGVQFADGAVLNEANNSKQFISVLDGLTGREISRTLVNNPYQSVGQMNGHMGIAYLDGVHPSVVWMAANRNPDESFNEIINTWDWNGSTLLHRWIFDLAGKDLPTGHQIKIFDIDGDGKDEIIPQACAIDDDGKLMYNLKDQAIDHGDRFSISDLDPKRPGLEIYGIQQGYSKLGIMWYYCDVKTGKLLLSQSNPANPDMGRGMTADFDPRYIGQELFTFVGSLYSVTGIPTSTAIPSSYPNQRIYWDGDLGSELLDGGKIVKWNYLTNNDTRLYTANSNTGTGAGASVPGTTPLFYGDIIGDWREEAVYESGDHEYLIVLETPYFTTHRIYTLPHNPGYRSDMSVKGYYQSNNPDFYLGFDMQQPPLPPIQTADKYWVGTTSLWDNSTANWNNNSVASSYAEGDTLMFDIRGKSTDTIRLNSSLAPGRIWMLNPEGKDYTIAGAGKLTGPMDIWKAKEGTFTLGGDHEYTGATMVTEGQFNVDGSVKSPVTVKGLGSLGGRGTLYGGLIMEKGVNVQGGRISPGFGNTNEKLGTLTVPGNLIIPGSNNFEFDVVPGSAKVNDSLLVTGNLTLNGTNKLIVKFANNLYVPGTYTLIKSNGTLTASLSDLEIEGIQGVAKELLIEDNSVKIKIKATRAPAEVAWNGSVNGSWDLDTENFLHADTTTAFVSGDTLSFSKTAALKNITLNETVFPASLSFTSAADYTIQGTGNIGGTASFTKSDTANVSMLLTGNTYTGKTIVNGGTLTVAKLGLRNEPSSIGGADSAAVNFQINNATLSVKEKSITDRALTIGGNTTINIPDQNNYAIFNANIVGSGALVKEGPGAIYMVGAKNFTGPVTIRSGWINLRGIEGNNNGLGTSKNITIEDGTLALDDVEAYSAPSWNITVPAGKNATLVAHGRSNMSGSLSGAGTLNIKIPYIRTSFSGNWSGFTGKIIVNDNDFRIANTFGYAKAAIQIASGKLHSISGAGSTIRIGELSGASGTSLSSDLSTANWIIGTKNTNSTYSGTITKTSLTKTGTGTLILNGANSYSGTTTVNGGRLLVNNAQGTRGTGSGAVLVDSGAVLGGTGFIKGAITIRSGKIQPGADGIGTFTDSTSITLTDAATTEMEINKGNSTFDVLKVTGALKLAGKLVLIKTGSGEFVAGDAFKLFDAGSYSGAFSSIEPESPGSGLSWDLSELNAAGKLKVMIDGGAGALSYYWKGAPGSAASPTNWSASANWNTISDGSGSVRSSSLSTDVLIIDGSALSPENYYVAPASKDSAGTLLILNSAKVVLDASGGGIYTGKTQVNSGRLLVNGTNGNPALTAGQISVGNSGILGGEGYISGPVTVNAGGKIQPGIDATGTLTDSTGITLASDAIVEMDIDKTSGNFDILRVLGPLQYNGKLVINRTGAEAFVPGDTFQLFQASTYSGAFTSIEPVTPGTNLKWDLSQLSITGKIVVAADLRPKTYYWRGTAGSASSPSNWTLATNWSTARTGTAGANRINPAMNDILIFDGSIMGTADYFLGQISTQNIGSLKFVNGAKVTIASTVYPTTAINDAFTTSTYGNCTYSVTGSGGSFANLKAGDIISTAASVVNPMPYAEVLAVSDAQHMTVSKESTFPTSPQTRYFRVPTLYTDTLSIDASSSVTLGAGSGSFYSFVLNTKGGTIAGKVTIGSRGGHHKLISATPNAGGNAGLHFISGSSLTISTSSSGKWNYNLGNTIGLYKDGKFIYDDGNGNNNVTPGYSGDAGIVFESGSSFTMAGSGEHYTPLGASHAATNDLTYTPAVAFKSGSRYINNTSFVSAPQMIVNNINVSYPNLEFLAGFPGNLTLAEVENLTVGGSSGAAVNSGSLLVKGNIVNATANAINFGNVMFGGMGNQSIGGTGATSFNKLIIADRAELSLSRNISASNVDLVGKLNFGAYTISGTGTFSTYAPYTKETTTPFALGSSLIQGVNDTGAGTLVYEYPIGSSVSNPDNLPERTLYRSFSGTNTGNLSVFATGSTASETAAFSIEGSSYTTNAANLAAATPGFSYLLNINELSEQTIAFTALPEKEAGDEDFDPAASSSSGLPVSYTSSNPAVAVIINGKVHITGAGSATITAIQNGNARFAAAPSVSQVLNVYLPPLVKAKSVTASLDANGKALITPEMIDDGSVSYNGSLTLSLNKTEFACENLGSPVMVELTGIDSKGYVRSANAEVIVTDNLKPVLVAPSNQVLCFNGSAYSIPVLTATDNCSISSVSYSISGATVRTGTGLDASGNFNPGTSTIVWTVKDGFNNETLASTTVTVNSKVLASIPDVYALPAGVTKNTIYHGYGPSSIAVSAQASGGGQPYSYLWESGETTQSINVNTAGTYRVQVTDAMGCVANAELAVQAVDVRCGNKNNKVIVCHKGNAICIGVEGVQDHLNHGDMLGECGSSTLLANTSPEEPFVKVANVASVYPNPTSGRFSLQHEAKIAGRTVLAVINLEGRIVEQKIISAVAGIQIVDFDLSGQAPGTYLIRVNGAEGEKVYKVIIQY